MKHTGYIILSDISFYEQIDVFNALEKNGINMNNISVFSNFNAILVEKNNLGGLSGDYKKFLEVKGYENIRDLFWIRPEPEEPVNRFFIATAMSGLSKEDYTSLQSSLISLKNHHSEFEIFSEITNISDQDNFMSPKTATELDISEIHKCSHFVLFHLSDIQSSTLFELGIAHTLRKEITIFYKDKEHLPFMIKDLDMVSSYVKLIQIKDFEEASIIEAFEV